MSLCRNKVSAENTGVNATTCSYNPRISLTTGSRLGPYEILTPLGAGGMGEVYRARDTRLDRIVAIKVVATALVGAPELRERFDREARAVAALNHPHICTLHDIGHENGVDFLVMEHLEGETLADRLSRGALPVPEVMRYGSKSPTRSTGRTAPGSSTAT